MITRQKINMVWSLDVHNYFIISHRPVSSVGRASRVQAPDWTNTQGLKVRGLKVRVLN